MSFITGNLMVTDRIAASAQVFFSLRLSSRQTKQEMNLI